MRAATTRAGAAKATRKKPMRRGDIGEWRPTSFIVAPVVPHVTAATTMSAKPARPLVGLIMGSRSDWETMAHAAETLRGLGVPHEVRIVSAHRTPDLLFRYAESAERRGIEVVVAAAGGAAHLPGMTAAKTAL